MLKPERLERLGGYGFKQTKCQIWKMNQALPDFGSDVICSTWHAILRAMQCSLTIERRFASPHGTGVRALHFDEVI